LQCDAYIEFQHLEGTEAPPKIADLMTPLNFFDNRYNEDFLVGKFNYLNFATVISRVLI
jgi:hypothetical protein